MAKITSAYANAMPKKLSIGAIGLLSLVLSQSAFAVSCNFKNGDIFTEICGYLEIDSVQTGGQLKVHVASTTSNFDVHIRRAGNSNPNLQSTSFSGAGNYTPSGSDYDGLNWGSAYTINIPANWTSGIYEISFNNGKGSYSEFVAIKSAQPGNYSKVLVLDSSTTAFAYSPIGGKSMYGFNSNNGKASHQLSTERPTGRGQWAEHSEFVTWLDKQGIAYEAASMMDLHRDPSLLNNYNLVMLAGHNEYWSKEMRDNWDNYLAAGGNGAIFSGNTMWWQVRFSADNKHMICYKNANDDPLYGQDNSRVTTNWFKSPVNRPENLSIGTSFQHGGYANYTTSGQQYYVKNGSGDDGSYGGFKVTDATHWAFTGTNLANGNIFGRGDDVNSRSVVGYEVDGALFSMSNNKPVVTGEDGTPSNFQILATTPAYAVNSPSLVPGVVHNNYAGQGWGTMGIFQPTVNGGVVFTAPTIDWAEGLNDPQVGLITKNVIEKLKTRGQSSSSSSSEPSQSTTTTSGGGGSLPISGLLLGLLAIFRLKPRKQ
ncbi:N,N-dimethylformamidase beta subunit family domain-containing protein [Thiothrix lacustris]|uniref:N,N-dimethylformamidase beta subunit family domain-containing protein n=1 Tax=Thiothrix lacustris TaxID=525917 RepID=UPI000491DBE7|nr:N,N-dimethylformamidase beta subunit family domain-containing protein [Thiothrix lacustris]